MGKLSSYHEAGHLVLALSERYNQKYNTDKLIHINQYQVKGLSHFPDVDIVNIPYPKAENEEEYLKLKTEALKVIGGIVSEVIFCGSHQPTFKDEDYLQLPTVWKNDLIKFHKIMDKIYLYENNEYPKQDDVSFKREFLQSQIEYLRNSPKLQKQIELVKNELLEKKNSKPRFR